MHTFALLWGLCRCCGAQDAGQTLLIVYSRRAVRSKCSLCSALPAMLSALPVQLKRAISEYLDQHALVKASPEVQEALAAASGSFRELPQHRGFLQHPASGAKRRSFDAGACRLQLSATVQLLPLGSPA